MWFRVRLMLYKIWGVVGAWDFRDCHVEWDEERDVIFCSNYIELY